METDTICTEKHFEYCVCQITVGGKSYMLVCVYRSPAGNLDLFLSELDIVLNSLYAPDRCLLVCGDFNVNFQLNDDDVSSVLQLMTGYGMQQHVEGITRVGAVRGTQLDNFFSSLPIDNVNCSILNTHLSDHYGQILCIKSEGDIDKVVSAKKRFYTPDNIDRFISLLRSENWDEIYSLAGVEEKYQTFYNMFFYHFDAAFPVSTFRPKNKREKWVNHEIKKYSSHIKDLYVWSKITASPFLYNRYKQERREYRRFLSEYRIAFNENKIINSRNVTKTAWGIFNSGANKNTRHGNITIKSDNGMVVTDALEVANIFLENFNIPPLPHGSPVVGGCSRVPTMFLLPSDIWEVCRLIKNLPNKYSAGLDEIPVVILKRVAEYVASPLTHIINECLLAGIFPSPLKKAKIVPIYKKRAILRMSVTTDQFHCCLRCRRSLKE